MKDNNNFNNSINSRQVALEVIIEVLEKNQFVNLTLNAVLSKYQFLPKQQRSYITRVVNGVVERRDQIDFIINAYSNTKTSKMKESIRNILRLSVYEIFYMDSIPVSATCNEAVKLTKQNGPRQLAGFVNGVLRSIARDDKDITINDWQTKYSMPEFIIDIFKSAYGAQKTEEILQGFFEEQNTCVRTNLSLISSADLIKHFDAEKVDYIPVDGVEDAFYISNYDYLESLESFKQGYFYVQDLSSMMVAETILKAVQSFGLSKNDDALNVIDVCGAPGGKSLHLASLLSNQQIDYKILSCDISELKVDLIKENISRACENNVEAKAVDASEFHPEYQENFDIVIADLPCSGLGVIGKKPDIKYHLNPESLVDIEALQRSILDNVFKYLKNGGILLYSTCTINPGENQNQVKAFLDRHNEFSLLEEKLYFPSKEWDGFYIACLNKKF